MKIQIHLTTILLVCGGLLCLAGCGSKEPSPPPPMAIEEAPVQLQRAVQTQALPSSDSKSVHAETQALLNEAVAALQAKNYTQAFFLLQNLSLRSDLTADQRSVVSRSLLAVNQALSAQANAGNLEAQQAMKIYRANK